MTPITLWHELRQTRLVTLLQDRIRLLEKHCNQHLHEKQLLTLRCESMAAQLEASRMQHAKALQRVDSLEVALEHISFELNSCKRRGRKARAAMRNWLDRQKSPRITTN